MRFAKRIRIALRSAGLVAAQRGAARRAAATARATSSALPSATSAMVSPVAGFSTGYVRPEAASTNSPSMNDRVRNAPSVELRSPGVMTDMSVLPFASDQGARDQLNRRTPGVTGGKSMSSIVPGRARKGSSRFGGRDLVRKPEPAKVLEVSTDRRRTGRFRRRTEGSHRVGEDRGRLHEIG